MSTYRSPSAARVSSVDTSRKFPRVEIADCRHNGLHCLGAGDKEIRARRGREAESGREEVDDFVDYGEEERMYRGSEPVIPFLERD